MTLGRLVIEDVQPVLSGGKHLAKGVVNEVIPVSATIWREGHDALSGSLWVKGPGKAKPSTTTMNPGETADSYHAVFQPTTVGMWTFRVDAWSDVMSTWRHHVIAKIQAGQGSQELNNDLEIGARYLDQAASKLTMAQKLVLADATAQLRDTAIPVVQRVALALGDEVTSLLSDYPVRQLLTRGKPHRVWVDRQRALFSAWYEIFPRSTGGRDTQGKPIHGTFQTAANDLERIAHMGFDVVYLPPIHPIGQINRKGKNNSLIARLDDPGSPWAIGSSDGGHDAINPLLGTIDDFDAFVERAKELKMEVALDLALQSAPDHPWAKEHPEWFTILPDGTIAYAENPPKKYQDIYPIDFDKDPDGILAEVLRVIRHWASHGVRIFRVDNPHTKPASFWGKLIAQVKSEQPDILFLSEAFTRPARMYGLAAFGFSQSYTYFTWKTAKWEIEQFMHQTLDHIDAARPNMFTNTPDILHESLQTGGPGAFAIRSLLASTLSASWGMYSGFEIFEHEPAHPGSEEYLHSEKYELRPRDFARLDQERKSLTPWITKLNTVRQAHRALQQVRQTHFHHVDNDAIIAYSKFDPATGDSVLIVINLNPFGTEAGTLILDMPALGLDWYDSFDAYDEVSGETFHWQQRNYVELNPVLRVGHIVSLPSIPPERREELVYRTVSTD